MNENDLFRLKVFFKNGETFSNICTLTDFENWYGNETREIYDITLELVKEYKKEEARS